MANTYLETAFNVPVTADEAALLEECFETAAEISAGYASIPQEGREAAGSFYASRSSLFRATFPPQPGNDDPFVTFRALWSDPDFPCIDADLTINDDPVGKGQDRKTVVEGTSVSVRVELGVSRNIKKQKYKV